MPWNSKEASVQKEMSRGKCRSKFKVTQKMERDESPKNAGLDEKKE